VNLEQQANLEFRVRALKSEACCCVNSSTPVKIPRFSWKNVLPGMQLHHFYDEAIHYHKVIKVAAVCCKSLIHKVEVNEGYCAASHKDTRHKIQMHPQRDG